MTGLAAFLRDRWRGDAPVGLVFWRDMIVVGSLINLATAFASLMALGFKAGTATAAAIFFAPLPYNLLLFWAVWRAAGRQSATAATFYRASALVWTFAATLI